MNSRNPSPRPGAPEGENCEERLTQFETRLETRMAYLEAAQEDLNSTVLAQAKAIEAQTGEIRRLKAKLAYLEETLPSETPSPESERPPHY